MEFNVPLRANPSLFDRLPFEDAVKLAILVGTGQMTWAEVKAALDGMVKLAGADVIEAQWGEHHAPAPERIAEDEIWARYHAQCDEVFGRDTSPSGTAPLSREQLWQTEQVLDRLRSVRDRDLAAARRQLRAHSAGPISSAIPVKRSHAASSPIRLTPVEYDALRKLDATGFVGSASMVAAIETLAAEIVETIRAGARRGA